MAEIGTGKNKMAALNCGSRAYLCRSTLIIMEKGYSDITCEEFHFEENNDPKMPTERKYLTTYHIEAAGLKTLPNTLV